MTKLTQQNAENIFTDMLIEGEYTLYPVYCGFQETVFFARPGRMQMGYAACTNFGRLFMANLGYGLESCFSHRFNQLQFKPTLSISCIPAFRKC